MPYQNRIFIGFVYITLLQANWTETNINILNRNNNEKPHKDQILYSIP